MSLPNAYIAVGANLGDKIGNCRKGIELLNARADTRLVGISRTYRTAPVDFLDQGWFINLAVKIETRLDPFELLTVLQDIQRRVGQGPKAVRFGPRLLDLDIIFYDREIINTPQLVLPHPRMHQRRFVLQPLCDMDPGLVHPVLGEGMQVLLDKLNPREQEIEVLEAYANLLNGTMLKNPGASEP